MRPVVENPPERNAGNSDTVFQHFPIFPHTEAKIALSPPRGARGRRKGRPNAQSIKYVPKPEIRKTAFRRISVLQTGGETHTLRMLFFVGARATIGRPLEEQGTFPQCSHNSKGSLVQRELARQRLRDCKSLAFAGKKKKIVCVRYNPYAALRAPPPLTQGRLICAPTGSTPNAPATVAGKRTEHPGNRCRKVGGVSGKTSGFSQPVHRIFHRFSNFLLLFPRFSTSGIFRRREPFRALLSSRQSDFHGSMLLSSPVFEKFRSAFVSEKSVSFFKPLCRSHLSVFLPAFPVFHTTPAFPPPFCKVFPNTPSFHSKTSFLRFSRGYGGALQGRRPRRVPRLSTANQS